MKKLLCMVLVLMMVLSAGAAMAEGNSDWEYIKGKGKITIGITLFAPINYYDESGELIGFDTELAKATFEKLGVEVEFIEINWDSKEIELNSKNIDAIWNGMCITEERKQNVNFSVSYIKAKQSIVVPEGSPIATVDDLYTEGATYAEYDGAVDLRVYLPDAKFELLFASPNNITGSAMYPAVPLMEEKTAEMLKQAFEIFQNDGYTLKVYDAYRPRSAQVKLYDIVQNNKFIANPYTGGSWHQRGRAIDMSLIDNATGLELEMPTPMHTFDDSAARYSRDSWTEEARKNVDYMTSVMESVGFGIIQTEWWHFENNSGPGGYLPDEIDFTSLTYKPVSEYQGG